MSITTVTAGQVYSAPVGTTARRRYVQIDQVRSAAQSPYALAHEVSAQGNVSRGNDRGIDRSLPITIALCHTPRGFLAMPNPYRIHETKEGGEDE